jgi:hypothetical protein
MRPGQAGCTGGEALGIAPQRNDLVDFTVGEHRGFGGAGGKTAGHNGGVAPEIEDLLAHGQRVERMMERERCVGQQPRDDGYSEGRRRAGAQRRQDRRLRLEPALQHRLEASHHHLGVAAGDRHQPRGCHLPGDHGHVGVGGGLGFSTRRGRIDRSRVGIGRERIVERGGAVTRTAEYIDVLHRRGLRGDGGGEGTVVGGADASHRNQRAAPGGGNGSGAIGVPPQQRHRRGDQARPQYPEQRQHGLDGIGHLQRDDLVTREPISAQPGGNGADGTIGLRVGQPPRRARGKRLAMGRIDQGEMVGTLRDGGAEQVVEGDASAGAGGLLRLRGSEDHDVPHGGGWRHQVSGR